jgi:hypothetical protein
MEKTILIRYTEDYSLFKNILGNRPVNELHIKRLMREYQKERLIEPIKINDKNQVIDGQHGLEAAKRLGLGVWYYSVGKCDLRHVPKFNSIKLNWTRRHFLNSYCELGYEPYKRLAEFMQTYPEFGIATASYILSCGKNSQGEGNQKLSAKDVFNDGKYRIEDLKKGYDYAAMISEYAPHYKGYKRSSFVRAIVPLFAKRQFSHEKFLKKLSANSTEMVDCSTVEQYRNLIEKIYNKNNQIKVNLRFI